MTPFSRLADRWWCPALLALAAIPMVCAVAWRLPVPQHVAGLTYLQWHSLLEIAAMLVCGAVVAVARNSRELEVPGSVRVLGSACAGALLLSLAHLLSVPGMPALLTENSHDRSVALSMASRLLLALALLSLAATPGPAGRGRRWLRWVPGTTALFVVATCATLIAWPEAMLARLDPAVFVLAKQGAAALLLGLFGLAAALFARRLKTPQPLDVPALMMAALLMALAEITLALRSDGVDLATMLGHVYKLLALCMVYRTIVTDSIRRPYQRLIDSRRQLHASEEELRTITDNIPAMVAFIDAGHRYRFVNRNYERWLGLTPEQMLGRTGREIFGEKAHATRQAHLERALSGQTFAVDHRVSSEGPSHGRWLNIIYMPKVGTDGQVCGVYMLSSDITDVMDAQRRALFLAEHDELTTLPNRAAFQVGMAAAIDQGTRDSSQFAVLLVDVDRFKVINDTLGHAAGDHLLQALAERMKQVVRGRDLVARMGGDEMCLLLHDVRDASHASEIAERILGALRVPVELRTGLLHHVTVSAGVAIFPQDGLDVATLLRHADIAMYRAKAAGRDGFALFTVHDGGPAEARLNLELELRAAIDTDQLVLHYQPRVDVATGRPVGVEALVRWQHPQRGLLAPVHFIDIAEETGLIVPMGAWVMREASQALRRLQQLGGSAAGLTMSVNVSALQFKNARLVDDVAEMIIESGCLPRQIELELTESAVMDQPDAAEATMRRLKGLGVRLAMDDFGTGYSSLAALKRFPVDCVKIDRSFVNDIPADSGDSALTRAIVAMGHSLGLMVVAEGVERSDQLEFLRREGCDEYQGYLFAKPMPEPRLAALLAEADAVPSIPAGRVLATAA